MAAENASGIRVLTGLLTVNVEWNKDENGNWHMTEIEGSEKTFECDLCILAMGFVGPDKV